MQRCLSIVLLVLGVSCLTGGMLRAQELVEEPSTDKMFPATVAFDYAGTHYELTVTGLAVRSKFFVKVYGIAHYMNVGGFADTDTALAAALDGRYAKQITMDFARGVDAEKIQNAYREGFEKNATEEELAAIESSIDTFVGYFQEKVEENEQYVLRWLPGGIVLTTVRGREMEPIANETFARVLWKIWLGKDSIVDRKKLVRMAVTEE